MVDSRRLLIVDDDPGIHCQLRGGLTGYHLFDATNREGAITALRAHEPDVVLLDLGLPPDPTGISEGISTLETNEKRIENLFPIVLGNPHSCVRNIDHDHRFVHGSFNNQVPAGRHRIPGI